MPALLVLWGYMKFATEGAKLLKEDLPWTVELRPPTGVIPIAPKFELFILAILMKSSPN